MATKRRRALVPANRVLESRPKPPTTQPWHGTIRWTVDRDAFMSGKQTAFDPKDGLLHVKEDATGAQYDVQLPQAPATEESPAAEPEGDFIDVEYREAR